MQCASCENSRIHAPEPKATSDPPEKTAEPEPDAPAQPKAPPDTAWISKLKVVELRKHLAERGLNTKGLKAVLAKRLREHEEAAQAQ